MLKKSFISSVSRGKKLLLSALFVGLAAFSFASMNDDDGGNKAKIIAPWHSSFGPIRITNSFTLKAGPNYHGSTIFNEERKPSYIQLNSLVTYQKGNVTYIIPYNSKVSVSTGRSNLQAINLKVNIHH